jgi:hypothetical protein
MRKYRKHAVIIILIAAAVITPSPDVTSQMIVAVPMYILYELPKLKSLAIGGFSGKLPDYITKERSIAKVEKLDIVLEVEKNITMIQKIIRLNKERELKEVLFKEVMSELKKTFETNDLESLKRLNFHFENEKPKIEDLDHELGGESLELVE